MQSFVTRVAFYSIITLVSFNTNAFEFSMHNLSVDVTRVVEQLRILSTLNDAELPSVTRVLFTQSDVAARSYLRELLVEADLHVREDAVGNIFGRLPAHRSASVWDPDAVGSGSHFDAIPESGLYDGTVGILGALEAVRALRDAGFRPRRPIEVVAFTSEEPTRFGKSCIGSRLLVGRMNLTELHNLRDDNGTTFADARTAAGVVGDLSDVCLRANYYSSFVELHIEQGKVLEQEKRDIGIVTAIAGPASADAIFEGAGGHAGGVLMRDRKDAVSAGAEFVLRAEQAALSTQSEDTVATCGVFTVEPGAENSIGRRVRVSLDVRDLDGARRDAVLGACERSVEEIGARRGLSSSFRVRSQDAPAACSPMVIDAVTEAANAFGYSHRRMASRAYHDSLLMAQKFPTGMIFIPCKDGVSHHWKEYASADQIEKGIRTLAHALARLSGSVEPDGKGADKDEL